MSFLGDLVDSIGTNKAPTFPKPAPRPPVVSSAANTNPTPRPKSLPNPAPPSVAGLKRKLDERETKEPKVSERPVKPNPLPASTSRVAQKPFLPAPNGTKLPAPKPAVHASTTASSASAKPPTKGSYAAMMARAKEAQQSRTQNPLGTIKHQATSKEKISKLAERRRQEQDKAKADKDKKSEKPAPGGKPDRKRGASPVKKSDQTKVPRAPRPPLHAPASSSSSYKGTMGTASNKPRDTRVPKKTRYDEYLGTDEEDNSEEGYGDDDDDNGYGYGSEGSSDMEAGMDDLEFEEKSALRAAKEDDAKEMAIEAKLKREKEERKRRLEAMARKGR